MRGLLRKGLARLACDARGATAIEYALIAALIAVAIVGGVQAVGGGVATIFNDVEQKVSNATSDA